MIIKASAALRNDYWKISSLAAVIVPAVTNASSLVFNLSVRSSEFLTLSVFSPLFIPFGCKASFMAVAPSELNLPTSTRESNLV